MSAVEVTINGVLYDKLNRTTQNVVLIGEAFLTGLGVGGGPMPGGPPLDPNAPRPTHPIMLPGMPGWGVPPGTGIWPNPPEGQAPLPSHPIALPGDPWWPTNPPPTIPPPGSPPVMIPGTQPVHPIAPPPAIIVDYPGIGKVLVPQPTPPAS
jgi:hypothetical protein